MITISYKAKAKLQNLKETYGDYKTPQEYGRTAFWLWFDQIQDCMYSLNDSRLQCGEKNTYTMEYWGSIVYSKYSLGNGGVIVVIEDFNFNMHNFKQWLNHKEMENVGLNQPPSSGTTTQQRWHKLQSCENGFDIVMIGDDRLRNYYYNFTYCGNIVFTQNDNRTPLYFSRVTPFKSHNGVWLAQGILQGKTYTLRTDGTIVGFGGTSVQNRRRNRQVTQAEYNHYRRYGLGDSINRLNNIIEQTVRRLLREEVQKKRNSSLW